MLFRENKATGRLQERLKALEIRCDDQDRTRRNLELEFTELCDKVRHQMSRMAKRQSAEAKANGELAPADEAQDGGQIIDPISKSIMLRRGGYGRR